jgi:hypothetical protein
MYAGRVADNDLHECRSTGWRAWRNPDSFCPGVQQAGRSKGFHELQQESSGFLVESRFWVGVDQQAERCSVSIGQCTGEPSPSLRIPSNCRKDVGDAKRLRPVLLEGVDANVTLLVLASLRSD